MLSPDVPAGVSTVPSPWGIATVHNAAVAQSIIACELHDDAATVTRPEAGERVFHKLGQRLAKLITLVGYEALLARAIHLAHRQFPFIDDTIVVHGRDFVSLRFGEGSLRVEPRAAFAALAQKHRVLPAARRRLEMVLI